MKVIFSRKGFDSKAGGGPSPIIDGRPVSLPIPERKYPTPLRYADLEGGLAEIVADLTRGKHGPDTRCHLDPDLDAMRLAHRPPGWRGCLGQIGSAQGHLRNQGVAEGDLFLFWGSFRPAARGGDGRWRYSGRAEDRIFGWLQIAEILDAGADGSTVLNRHPWLRDHPHARPGWPGSNTLYVAADALRLPGRPQTSVAGWGVLPEGYRLSSPEGIKSRWVVPRWLCPPLGCGMTYHGQAARWDAGSSMVASVAQGQEFVADIGDEPAALDWLGALLRPSSGGHTDNPA